MPIYSNIGGNSGVVGYKYGADWIEVEFRSGRERFYTYTFKSPGSHHVEQMKVLAAAGNRLNAYINKNVKKQYASKR